ncbi:hypothetical protein J4416_00220 [Candidatus Pacearchaeota archaeon]|nr:hypothetical protein [Candidatus Pacearchaeota archaeon]
MKRIISLAIALLLVFIMFFYFASALNDTMIVEANIFANAGNNSTTIRVEVPDYLFFGNVTNFERSEELKVYVNNTGDVDITVTPDLINRSEIIFNNLYLRKFRTSNGTAVNYTRIGNFNFNINKPATGQTFNDEYFYIILDLTNNPQNITSDLIGHRTNVKFFAVAR